MTLMAIGLPSIPKKSSSPARESVARSSMATITTPMKAPNANILPNIPREVTT